MTERQTRLLRVIGDDMARMEEIHRAQEARTQELMKYLVTSPTINPQKVTWRRPEAKA